MGSSSQAFILNGGPKVINGVCVFGQMLGGIYGFSDNVYFGYYLYSPAACPANAIQTTVNATAFCCTTSDGAPVGSATANFCCTKAQ